MYIFICLCIGITQSDLLVINKIDLADAIGASLDIMRRDADLMRRDGPTVFAEVKHGPGVDEIVRYIEDDYIATVVEQQQQSAGEDEHIRKK